MITVAVSQRLSKTSIPISIIVLFLITRIVHSAPSNLAPFDLVQPDGYTFQAVENGDEFVWWTETIGGYSIVQDGTGWYYAELDATGNLVSSGTLVSSGSTPPSATPKHLAPPKRDAGDEPRWLAKAAPNVRSGEWYPFPVEGRQNLLVILVGFADRALTTTPADWHGAIFDETPNAKTVANYYREHSGGAFGINPVGHTQAGSPAGVIEVNLARNHPNYGGNITHGVEDPWINEALVEAAGVVNFANLDANADGAFDGTEIHIYFVVAGFERSGSRNVPNIWAHAWSPANAGDITAGGINVMRWALNGELNNGGNQHPIGVIAHELGHSMLGLPDLYDTDGNNSGLGAWSLMAQGSWGATTAENGAGNAGATPVGLDAWSMQYLGWTEPAIPSLNYPVSDLVGNATDGIPLSFPEGVTATGTAKMLNPTVSPTQYFLAQNRRPIRWDEGLERWMGAAWTGGLLVQHIDIESGNSRNDGSTGDNDINASGALGVTQQGVLTEEADGGGSGNASTVDHLFREGHNAAFSPASNPNTELHDGTATNWSLHTISAAAARMTGTPSIPHIPDGVGLGGDAGEMVMSTDNSRIYFFVDNVLHAVNTNTGAEVWQHPMGFTGTPGIPIIAPTSIASEDHILFTNGATLYCGKVDASASGASGYAQEWTHQFSLPLTSHVAYNPATNVVAVTGFEPLPVPNDEYHGIVYAYQIPSGANPGKLLWQYEEDTYFTRLIFAHGNLVCGEKYGDVFAFHTQETLPTGTNRVRWRTTLAAGALEAVEVVAASNTPNLLYVEDLFESTLRVINVAVDGSTGRVETSRAYPSHGFSPLVDHDGNIICARYNEIENRTDLVSLNPTLGDENWDTPLTQEGGLHSAPAVLGNGHTHGVLYTIAGYAWRELRAYDLATGSLQWAIPFRVHAGTPGRMVMRNNGELFITRRVYGEDELFKIRTESYDLLSCWPTEHGNSHNTGFLADHGTGSVYDEKFERDTTFADLGYVLADHWEVEPETGCISTSGPGGWNALSKAVTPLFSVHRDDGPIYVEWAIQLPTDNTGRSWRENNKVWMALLDKNNEPLYEIMFKPNRAQDRYTSFDLELTESSNGVMQTVTQAWTHTLTPTHAWLRFRLAVDPTTNGGGDGRIVLYYDTGEGYKEYLSAHSDIHERFNRLRFTYKTGSEPDRHYYSLLDDIIITQVKNGN